MFAETKFTVEDFRKRIQAISDEQLIRFGKAARYMADPRNSADKRTVRDVYVTQLELCREEWRRRHPEPVQRAVASLENHPPSRLGLQYYCAHTGRDSNFDAIWTHSFDQAGQSEGASDSYCPSPCIFLGRT